MDRDISPEKLAEYRESFNMFDTSKCGLLTKESIVEFCQKIKLSISQQCIEDVFSEIDVGGTGTIDFTEFICFMEKIRQSENYQKFLKASFDIFDKTGSGMLNAESIMKTMKDLGTPFTEEDAKAVVDSLDVSGRGYITFEAFLHLMST